MPSEPRAVFRMRLEDAVALSFFLINLLMRIVFQGLERRNLSPADVLIIIPAVVLLLSKELAHYFLAGRDSQPPSRRGPLEFVRPYWVIVRDWFPFLVILLMYYSLWGDATHLLVTSDRDAELIALDQKLFGCQASLVLQRFVSKPLTDWMSFAYFFHILNIPIVGLFIYTRRSKSRFREMMSGVLLICFFGLLGYVLVPAVGPMYTLRDQYTVPLYQSLDVFNRQLEFMDFARIKRDVFPSMHVGISFLVWLYAWRNSRPLAGVLAPLILSLGISTVYLRYHYLIDVVAGLLLAPACFLLANWLFGRFGEIEMALPFPRSWVSRYPWLRSLPTPSELPTKAEERP